MLSLHTQPSSKPTFRKDSMRKESVGVNNFNGDESESWAEMIVMALS